MIEYSNYMWLLLTAAAAFLIGELFGDYRRHSIYLKEANDALQRELEKATTNMPLYKELRRQRGMLNDLHKRVLAVTKASPKLPF
jgi:hypothetical protein